MEENYLSDFDRADVDLVVENELNRIARYTRHVNPSAVLLAGQPGAGKTVLSSMLSKAMRDDVFFINADEYRRFHPHYQGLHELYGSDSAQMTSAFSGAVTEALIHALSDEKLHLIIEGTGRTTEVPHRTAELLTGKEYRVELAVIAARPELSLCSTLLRFYEMNERGTIPRATAAVAHDHIVDVLPDNLDILHGDAAIAKLTIWDRTPDILYASDSSTDKPSEVLRSYWYRPWSDEEYDHTVETISLLRQKEEQYHLGQTAAIDELAQRVQNAAHELSFDQTMFL